MKARAIGTFVHSAFMATTLLACGGSTRGATSGGARVGGSDPAASDPRAEVTERATEAQAGPLDDSVVVSPQEALACARQDGFAVAGDLACLARAGRLYCWGDLRPHFGVAADTAVAIDAGRPVHDVALSRTQSCVLDERCAVRCAAVGDSVFSAPAGPRLSSIRSGESGICGIVPGGGGWVRTSRLVPAPGSDSPRRFQMEYSERSVLSGRLRALDCGTTLCAVLENGEIACAPGGGTLPSTWMGAEIESGLHRILVSGSFRDVASAAEFICAVEVTGELWCWGQIPGQTSSGPDGSGPRRVPLPGPAVQVDSGDAFVCATLESGQVACLGEGAFGQLGAPEVRSSEARVSARIADAVEVSAGDMHACARLASGEVVCWGHGGDHGRLGDGARHGAIARTPEPIDELRGVEHIAAHSMRFCALQRGAIRCAGVDLSELGVSRTDAGLVQVPLTNRADRIVLGESFICGHAVGSASCVADEEAASSLAQTMARRLERSTMVSASIWGDWVCGSDRDRSSACWHLRQPSEVPLGSRTRGLTVGGDHACSVSDHGAVSCLRLSPSSCFSTGRGALDCSDAGARAVIDPPAAARGVVELSAGLAHTCGRHADGRVVCWGLTAAARVGDGGGQITDATAIASGSLFACALHRTGHVSCWGDVAVNVEPGTLGRVAGLADVEAIWAGASGACARRRGGEVLCWDQVPVLLDYAQTTPVRVRGLPAAP